MESEAPLCTSTAAAAPAAGAVQEAPQFDLHEELMHHLHIVSRGFQELSRGYERTCVACLGGCGYRPHDEPAPARPALVPLENVRAAAVVPA